MSDRQPLTTFVLAEAPTGSVPADVREADWIPAVVPGGVHESLLAAGRIEHPYYDRNEESVRWIEERDWWFRCEFDGLGAPAAEERVRLVFHGLDSVADVWLNGEHLGHHENMFRPAEFDVTARLTEQNVLLLRFCPPLAGLTPPASALAMNERLAKVFAALSEGAASTAEGGMSAVLPLTTLRRKATFSWGWDFGPRLPSVGVWRPVELVRETHAAITEHHIRTDALDGTTALVTALVGVDVLAGDLTRLTARVTLTAPSGAEHTVSLPVTSGENSSTLRVPDAELWWTHDLGAPALHDVVIELVDGDGTVLDRRTDRVGLRTVGLDRSPDPEGGRYFRFLLNGIPIFARGAAWLPADMLVGSVGEARYRELIGLARDANMTMLRIWGGGIYEHDAFYAATDELGILVWQDFMFACIDYPSEDPVLRREVALEAEYQVRRLRNRASVALWSGNNEVQLIHGFAYQDYEPGNWGWDFFHRLLPETVERVDGTVPYWPGSPWGEDKVEGWMAVNGVRDGDRHAWEVWHGFDVGAGGGPYDDPGQSRHYRRYANDLGKFISEFGIHASPELATLKRWIPAESLSIHSPSFDAHNKDHPKDKGDPVLEIVTGLPQTMTQYVDFTMAAQAEGLKFGVEHYRRRQPHCSGTLVWQFNDVWPGFSWSVVDHDAVPKSSWYALRRAYAPVLASFAETAAGLELWVSNSTAAVVRTTAVVELTDADGATTRTFEIAVSVEPGESRCVWTRSERLRTGEWAWVSSADKAFGPNRVFGGEVRDLHLGVESPKWTVERTGDTSATVTLRATSLTYQVRVTAGVPGVRYSDNYLDLRPGDEAVIVLERLPADFDPATVTVQTYGSS
ncbi:glycoside hydrolase family 2 protein [Salinispora arenicola]|uniref:beta-mannosidase n=1 Tax=Salinispora arenicola TaxID=168697 RepID=A0A542XLH5_SALAC|nr:glycoside hydrolase family 2 protein [Salinispora arenicola]TQL36699.1 beta-mannosidase [Salinispora arenicola]GIM87543.1 beta-mannosidase [Salinispora arenicola]